MADGAATGEERDPANIAAGYALAFDFGIRALARQERRLDELRSRTGILLSASAIATSFLGERSLGDHPSSPWSLAAIACFLLVGAASVRVLWPRGDWLFSPLPGALLTTYVEPPDGDGMSVSEIHRDLAHHMQGAYDANEHALSQLVWAMRLIVGALVIEVAAWIMHIVTVS